MAALGTLRFSNTCSATIAIDFDRHLADPFSAQITKSGIAWTTRCTGHLFPRSLFRDPDGHL